MSTAFWIKRFFLALVVAFAILFVAHDVEGHGAAESLRFSALWAIISAAIFTGTRIYRSRRDQHCAICKDTPEMQGNTRDI